MLRRQYGTATSSSLAAVTHAEDAQPNEGINKRSACRPPTIRSARSEATSIHYRGSRGRGGYRGTNMNHRERGRPLGQYAIRGNPAWRGRGRGFRVYPDRTPNTADVYYSSSSTSSSSRGSSNNHPTPEEDTNKAESSHAAARRRIQELRSQISSQTPAPHLPPPAQDTESDNTTRWMCRSRSPTPKLPPTPLTRRKITNEEDPSALPPKPSQSSSSPATLKLPLPGRIPKKIETVKKEPTSPSLKQELVSPGPLNQERKLITSACKFFPFPEDCRKSDPNYQTNRRTFVLDKNRGLTRIGLKREKAFVRDDGLVIEWSSSVPVWSDTLLPDTMDLATAIRQTYQISPSKPSQNHSVSASRQKFQSSNGPSSSQSKISRASPKPIKTESSEVSYPTTQVHPSPTKKTKRTIDGPPSLPSKRARISPPPDTTKTNSPSRMTHLPTPTSQPDSQLRLPLPGRRSLPSKLTPVPIAFLPRPSRATPMSLSQSTIINLKNHSNTTGRKLSISESSQRTTTASPAPSPPIITEDCPTETESPHDYPQMNHSQPITLGEDDNSIYPMHESETPKHTEISLEFKGIFAAETDYSRMVDSDDLDAENVATALLTRASDNSRPSDDDIEVDASADDDPSGEIVEALVSDYLLRYCQLFDSDRSKLEMAYDENALFSCRVHHQEEPSFSMAGLFAPEVEHSFRSTHSRATASAVHQGRTHILNKLLSLGPYQFCPRGVTSQLLYDTVDSATGVLLTVHGEVVNPHISNPDLDHVLTLDQSFVLRRTSSTIPDVQFQAQQEADVNNNNNSNGRLRTNDPHVWPLVAVSHQMTVRAAPFLCPEKLEEALPWIREMVSPTA